MMWLQRLFFWLAVWAFFGSCLDGVWVFLHLQCPDGVCIGWACALWLQRLFYVDSKGLDGVWVFLHLQCPDGVCIGWACALWLQSCFMWFQMVFA